MTKTTKEHEGMKVTFLGTGTSQGVPVIACECAVCKSNNPKDKRLRVSVHIVFKGKSIVVDTGPDFRQQMLRADIRTLDAILMTHEHKDHIAGLDDIRAFNYKSGKAMRVYASLQVQAALKREFYYVFEENPYPGVPRVELKTISNDKFQLDDIDILPIEVMHYRMPVLGFRLGTFAYVTDAKTISEPEAEKLKGLDVLVLNALRKEDHISHLTLSEALEWIEKLAPKQAYLTHISHLMGKQEQVGQLLPANVHLAYDGLQLDF